MTPRVVVGVEMERRPARSRWQAHVWRAVALHPGGLDLPEWAPMGGAPGGGAEGEAKGEARDEAGGERFYAGTAEIALHPGDTQVYKDNVEAPRPSVYVVLRRAPTPSGLRLYRVTVDPSEAHAHVDVGDDLVEALPMPGPLRGWIGLFVARHHVERPRWKRRRDRVAPDAPEGRPPPVWGPAWGDEDDD